MASTRTITAHFEGWVAHEQASRSERAARRAREAETGRPEDDLGRWWLERTAVLEQIAEEALKLSYREPGLCAHLATLVGRLNEVKPPACREGDHA